MTASRKELTWKPYGNAKGGRWFKKVDNKCRYFGSAPNKSDRSAYRKAVSKYRAFMEQRDIDQLQLDRIARKQKEFEANGSPPEYAAWMLAIGDIHKQNEQKRQQAVIAEAQALTGTAHKASQRPRLPDLIDIYLAEQERRHSISQSNPEALPHKRRLSHAGLRSIKAQIQPFKTWVTKNTADLGEDSQATETVLREYRNFCDDLMVKGKIQAATVSNRVRGLKRFVEWLWQRRHLDELPRGLNEICEKYAQAKQARSLTKKEIGRLWKHANPRMRAMMALSLNCGFYFSEIAQLRGRDLREGYIARRRPKTGVPSKHKLWKLTEKLVAETRDNLGDDQLIYQTRQGFPLVHDNGTRCDSLHAPWRDLCKRAKVTAKPSELRDTAATFIEGVGVRTGNPKLVSQFLAHADGRTARWYIDQNVDPHGLDTDALDAAIGDACNHYVLTFRASGQATSKV